jgi:PAS domain S-box-containing protein
MNVQMMSKRGGHALSHLSLLQTAERQNGARAAKIGRADAFFFSLVGAIPNPVFVKDAQLRYIYVNDAFCSIVKRTRGELIDRNEFELSPPEQSERLRQIDLAVLADGVPRQCADVLTDSKGNQITILRSKSRFVVPGSETGEGRYLLGMITDTTLQKRAETELRSAKMAAEVANRAKSSFLANMSHELRTPLNAIIGFSEVIKDDVFGVDHERYRDYADDIFQSGGHLLKLINDILDISKIDAGKFQLHEEACDLSEAVSAALRFVRDSAVGGGVTLDDQVSSALPLLRADLRSVTQIVTNLVANAVKFTEPGGRVEIAATIADGCLSISVADTGIGMEPSDIPLALTAFEQIDSVWARRYEGTGLGLPLTKALLKLHGGSLEIETQLGQGTTVTARFPTERTIPRPIGEPGPDQPNVAV